MELINLDEVLRVLMDFARDMEENYKEQLISSGHYTTDYALLDSVKTNIVTRDRGYEVTLTLNDYWKYVEYDTKPHFPPPSALLRYVQIKPIFPRPNELGRKPTENQLAYLIGRKISRVGTEGTHDMEKTKDALIPFYKERLAEALNKDVTRYFQILVKDM